MQTMSLARQIDLVFRELKDELSCLDSGTVFIQIRNNSIGKFGIRHNPFEGNEGIVQPAKGGLNEHQWHCFKDMALKSLNYKKFWTHGEILYDFAVLQNRLRMSVQFESNYNMSNLISNRSY